MKQIYICTSILFLLMLVGCKGSGNGTEESSGTTATAESAKVERLLCGIEKYAVGTWEQNESNNNLTYKDDCTYTSTHCQGEGKIIYANTIDDVQFAYIIVKQSNGATDCLEKGTYLCAYKFNSEVTLSFTCDGETIFVYTKVE